MKFEDLKGLALKKDLDLIRGIKRYHNKHTDNSGNFGFTLIKKDVRVKGLNNDNQIWFSLDGDYNKEHDVFNLSLGRFSSCGTKLNSLLGFSEIIEDMKSIIEEEIEICGLNDKGDKNE